MKYGGINRYLAIFKKQKKMVVATYYIDFIIVGVANCIRRQFGNSAICLLCVLKMNKYKNIFTMIAILVWFAIIFFITKSNLVLYFVSLILFLSIISTRILHFVIYSWTKFGDLLGSVNSKIVLFILFYLILTPYSFVLKIFNKKVSILTKNDKTSFTNKSHTYNETDFINMW